MDQITYIKTKYKTNIKTSTATYTPLKRFEIANGYPGSSWKYLLLLSPWVVHIEIPTLLFFEKSSQQIVKVANESML